jgi:SAM-dependent methyltransferase
MLQIRNRFVQRLRSFFYPHSIESDEPFLKQIKKAIGPTSIVVDLGAGKGELFKHDLKGSVAKVIGVDLDEGVRLNPLLDEWHVGPIDEMRYFASNSIDCIFSRYVVEHVQEPGKLIAEIERVLKPGGRFIFLTPNRWHYFFVLSKITPEWFHQWVNVKRGIAVADTFRTYYRMNSVCQIQRLAGKGTVKVEDIVMIETDPRYLIFEPLSYLGAVAYERIVNATGLLRRFRINIVCTLLKAQRHAA